jgi:hypothetical protein
MSGSLTGLVGPDRSESRYVNMQRSRSSYDRRRFRWEFKLQLDRFAFYEGSDTKV